MSKQLLIKAKPREKKNPNLIRQAGFVPATVYGHGLASQSIQLNAKEFSKIPHKAYSHINELEVEGQEKFPVLIRSVQIDPVRDNYLNIEFYKIKSDEKIKVKVPLNYIGHSDAVLAGGVLIVSYNEIEIQCFPGDIPDVIDINLELIKEIGQSIHAGDLKIDQKIQILAKSQEVLAKVEIAKTHEVEEEKPTVAAVPVGEAAPAEAVPAKDAAQAAKAPVQTAKAPAQAAKAPAPAKAPEAKPAKK